MIVRLLKVSVINGIEFLPGRTLDVADPVANNLIGQGAAFAVHSNRQSKFRATVRNAFRVQASPATMTYNAAITIASPKRYRAGFRNGSMPLASVGLGSVRFSGSGRFTIAGVNSPDDELIRPQYLTRNVNPLFSDIWRMSFNHVGRYFEIPLKNINPFAARCKINGEFVSLTPLGFTAAGGPSANATGFWLCDMGSRDLREIEITGFNALLGGLIVEANDLVTPTEVPQERTIVMGDSWVGATGAAHGLAGWVQFYAEYSGEEDVWQSGNGGTGFVATNTGTEPNYLQRLDRDVLANAPTRVIFQASGNDNGFTYAQINANAAACFRRVRQALPNCDIVCIAPWGHQGPGFQGGRLTNLRAVTDACAAESVPMFDWMQLPLYGTAYSTVLSAAVSNSATMTFAQPLVTGAVYQFPDGTKFECLASTGIPATVTADAPMTQPLGTVATLIGSSLITGNGNTGGAGTIAGSSRELILSDTHPSPLGHQVFGLVAAQQVARIFGQ